MDLECPTCETTFTCGSKDSSPCWCSTYPPILPLNPQATCLCRDCLAISIGKAINEKLSSLDHDEAHELADTHSGTSRMPIEYIDYTVEDGLTVFTSWYLLKRGQCCGSECRHCPYREE